MAEERKLHVGDYLHPLSNANDIDLSKYEFESIWEEPFSYIGFNSKGKLEIFPGKRVVKIKKEMNDA